VRHLSAFVAIAVLVLISELPAQNTVIISEFAAVNASKVPLTSGEILDRDGHSSDWIELWNTSDETVNLKGWRLTDDLEDLGKWEFPSIDLGPDGYLVVFASGKDAQDPQAELHTNFRLASEGESLALVNPDGDIVHAYTDVPHQYGHMSYGLAAGDSGLQFETTLIETGAEATAWIPTDDSAGSDWTQPAFDDTTWAQGVTGVGYDYAGLIGLDTSAMRGVNQTVYIRVPFQIERVDSVDRLILRMKFEDGFVAYLNGVEVARSNAPNASPPAWNAGATTTHSDAEAVIFNDYDITAYRDQLLAGDNVLAIHGLNSSLSSSDLLVLPELVATEVISFDSGDVVEGYLADPTPGTPNQTALIQIGPAISQVTENPPAPAADEDLVITAQVTEVLGPVLGAQLYYVVNYDEARANMNMVDDGTGGDVTAGDDVYTAVIPAEAYGPGDMVRWYVMAIDSNGQMSRSPLFPYPDDSPEFYGTVVPDPSIQSELPVLYWFTENRAATQTRGGTRASVFYDGEFYDNIFVRRRGGATAGDSQKFAFNRAFRFRFSDEHQRVREFNLNTRGSDATYLRQPLAFETMRNAGSPGSLSLLMLSVLNGSVDRVGIYIEQVDEEFLERNGLDPYGALYKFVQRSSITPVFNDISTGIEKKTRRDEGFDDITAVVAGLNAPTQEARRVFVFDNFNLPQMMNYLAARCLLQDTDDIRKNFYFYRDTNGTGQWSIFPWDKDWTFGITGDGWIYTTHPFLGDDAHPKNNGRQWSVYLSVMYQLPETQEMFLRRLRTVMDEILLPPPLPSSFFEGRIDEMLAQAREDLPGSAVNSVTSLKNYFPNRRIQLYVDHRIGNTSNPPVGGCAGIPNSQPADVSIIFGDCDPNPMFGDQDAEYVQLINPNSYAVDISGWQLTGGIEYEFRPGTVIVSSGSLYVSPNVRAFRDRSVAPTAGQGLFVQGNYAGHLSNWGGTLELRDATGRLVDTLTYESDPSEQQRYLRITEIMYHPADGGAFDADEYEFIELTNIGAAPLMLDGAALTDGVSYTFEAGRNVQLAGGDSIVIVKNRQAFAERYNVSDIRLAEGEYTGSLSNGGERITLEDFSGSTIHDFEYEDSWYRQTDGQGLSLTIIDPTNADLNSWGTPEAWQPSPEPGGSPGTND